MDPKTYEINNLRILNDYLTQTIEVLARAQRVGLCRDVSREISGLSHTQFTPGIFGVPMQGMGVEPRVDYTGLAHSPYGVYPYPYGVQPFGGQPFGGQPFGAQPFGGQPLGAFPTNIDPFYAQRSGLSHTTATPWTGWTPATTAELARQRDLLARQQYEAMWRPMGI